MTHATVPKPVLDLIILDCRDALELGRFYSELLGWSVEEGSGRDWATLTPRRGRGDSGRFRRASGPGLPADRRLGRSDLAGRCSSPAVSPGLLGRRYRRSRTVGARPGRSAPRPPTVRGRRLSGVPGSLGPSVLPHPLTGRMPSGSWPSDRDSERSVTIRSGAVSRGHRPASLPGCGPLRRRQDPTFRAGPTVARGATIEL